MLHTTITSSFGNLLLRSDGKALTGVYFADKKHALIPLSTSRHEPTHELFVQCEKQLAEYAAGKRTFFDIPCRFGNGTPLQLRVWHALTDIPFGSTISYKTLAQGVGKPAAVRAVASAVGKNPLSIIIPCHRVMGSSGALTGYAGGLERKKTLLDLEKGF